MMADGLLLCTRPITSIIHSRSCCTVLYCYSRFFLLCGPFRLTSFNDINSTFTKLLKNFFMQWCIRETIFFCMYDIFAVSSPSIHSTGFLYLIDTWTLSLCPEMLSLKWKSINFGSSIEKGQYHSLLPFFDSTTVLTGLKIGSCVLSPFL